MQREITRNHHRFSLLGVTVYREDILETEVDLGWWTFTAFGASGLRLVLAAVVLVVLIVANIVRALIG